MGEGGGGEGRDLKGYGERWGVVDTGFADRKLEVHFCIYLFCLFCYNITEIID